MSAEANGFGQAIVEWLKYIGVAIGGGLFMELRYRRGRSRTRLGEAEDSGGRYHIRSLRKDRESLQDERAALFASLEETKDELARARERGARRDMQVQAIKAHVLLVTRLVSEDKPWAAKQLSESTFMTLFDDPPSTKEK